VAKVNVIRALEVVRVETSKLLDVARAAPVGTELEPYVPECAYNLATALPVGELSFRR
jgi:hypothetical protein